MSFENIKYDIILPFYDDYEFLDFQINCINYQTLKATNLIFIDDGNKDKDLEKNLRLKINPQINIVFISFQKNMGLFYGLNVGFDKLQSEYFRIGATDDFSDRNLASESLKILNKEEYTSNEVDLIFKKNQFKIYHNTVFYRTKFFLKNHLFQEIYGFRCDYLNLLYFSHLSGFVYVDKFLSEFTVRKGQINKMHDYKYLTGETKFLKKKNINFYNFYIENGLHYDFSPLSIFRYKFHKNSLFSMKWFVRSIKFRIWKQIRSILPNNIIQFLSNY